MKKNKIYPLKYCTHCKKLIEYRDVLIEIDKGEAFHGLCFFQYYELKKKGGWKDGEQENRGIMAKEEGQ